MTIIEGEAQLPATTKPRARVPAPSSPNPISIVQTAIEKGITGADLKEIMDLQERWEANQARKAFDIALYNATAEIPAIVKNRLVAFEAKAGGKDTSYRHEDLAQVIDTIRPHLFKHGLGHRFDTKQDMQNGGLITVTCIIYGHGHREETSLSSGPDANGSGMNNLQRIASATTYLERYTLKAALGLASKHDDDGRGSSADPADLTNITALQLEELAALIKEVNANENAVCKACHVEKLAEMTQLQFTKAKAKLEAMRTPL